jgi:predicted phage terminase large subunit-like protein
MSTNANLDHAVFYAALRGDLLTFAAKSLQHLRGNELKVMGHIRLMAAALIEFYEERTQNLQINIPPRLLKSLLATVIYVAWLVGKNPTKRVMIVTHDQGLADEFVNDVRTILMSTWFQAAFPLCRIDRTLSRSGHFKIEGGGEVLAKSLESAVTGRGFDLMIFDDPIDAGNARNPKARQKVLDLYHEKFGSRLNSKVDGQIMIVAQRLHRDDICGQLAFEPGWLRLAIPLVATEPLTHRVGDEVWERPAGHVLDLSRYSDDWIETEQRLRPSTFAAQCQQRPLISDSAILKAEWMRSYEGNPPVAANQTTISIDTAASRRPGASFTCLMVWQSDGHDHYVREVVRERLDYVEIRDAVLELIARFRPSTVLIEETTNGQALVADLKRLYAESKIKSAIKAVRPTAGKAERLGAHVDMFANGRILVPADRPIGAMLIDEWLSFEAGGGQTDQVDATSQYLDHIREIHPPGFRAIVTGAGGSEMAKHPTPGHIRARQPVRPPHPQRDPRTPPRMPYSR